jgi:hypothetical protein
MGYLRPTAMCSFCERIGALLQRLRGLRLLSPRIAEADDRGEKVIVMTRHGLALVAAGLLVLAACGGSDDTASDEIAETTWDVVFLGHSFVAHVAEPYAEHVAEANDVEVVLHNEWRPNLSVMSLSEVLADDLETFGWVDLVRDAEVVVYHANPYGLIPDGQVEHCGTGGGAIKESDCDGEWDEYREALERIAVDIKRLRDGQPTIIRTIQIYSPGVGKWEEAGVYDECMACDTYARDAEKAAADAQGVLIASAWDEFNGPDHTEDPTEKGYIAGDGYHPSAEGAQVMADLLHELGYEPTP